MDHRKSAIAGGSDRTLTRSVSKIRGFSGLLAPRDRNPVRLSIPSCAMRQVFDCGNFVESGFSHGPRLEIPDRGRMHVRADFLGYGCTNGKPFGKVGKARFWL
jgi:hypothetical protein